MDAAREVGQAVAPRGPWTEPAQVDRLIGPVRRTLEAADPLRPVAAGCVGIAALVAVAPVVAVIVAGREVAGLVFLACFGAALPAVVVLEIVAKSCGPPVARGRLQVGDRGLADWAAGQATVLLWDDLGTLWRPVTADRDEYATSDPALLLLEHRDGTRLRLRLGLPDVELVRRRVLAEIQGRQAALAMAGVAVDEDVAGETDNWPPPTPGPWEGASVAARIGPILAAGGPTAEAQQQVRRAVRRVVGRYVLRAVGCAALGGAILVRAIQQGAWNGPGVVSFLAIGWAVCFFLAAAECARLTDPLRSVLLLGEGGVAIWRPGDPVVLTWGDLADGWDVSAEVATAEDEQTRWPIVLKLWHPDGSRIYLTRLYEGVERVAARVRAAARRARPPDRPDPPPPVSQAIRRGGEIAELENPPPGAESI